MQLYRNVCLQCMNYNYGWHFSHRNVTLRFVILSISFFFGCVAWLTGSQFRNQGLNPAHSNECTES